MALRRKPQSESKKSAVADERHVEALINKGGSVSPDHEEGGGRIRPQLVQLRLPRALVQRIDKVRKHLGCDPRKPARLPAQGLYT